MIVWYGHHVGKLKIQPLPERFRLPHTRRILAWNVPSVQRFTGSGALQSLKKSEKAGDIGQDDSRQQSDRVQKMTDETIAEIDKLLSVKEGEIMQV